MADGYRAFEKSQQTFASLPSAARQRRQLEQGRSVINAVVLHVRAPALTSRISQNQEASFETTLAKRCPLKRELVFCSTNRSATRSSKCRPKRTKLNGSLPNQTQQGGECTRPVSAQRLQNSATCDSRSYGVCVFAVLLAVTDCDCRCCYRGCLMRCLLVVLLAVWSDA